LHGRTGRRRTGPKSRLIRYAKTWAFMMEREMAKGEKLTDIAESTSFKAAKEFDITNSHYTAAVELLSMVWKYGEALLQWHNLHYGGTELGVSANKDGLVVQI